MTKRESNVVDDHRNMLQVSKNISGFQEQNLKSWAFIFLDDVEKVEVNWNFFKNNKSKDFYAGKVTFDIKFKKGTEVDLEKAQLGIDRLTASTKFLFWNETKVTIKKSGKVWKINQQSESTKISVQPK